MHWGYHSPVLSQLINGLVQDCGNSVANTLKLPQSCAKPFDGLVQDCGNSIANTMELPQSRTELSIYYSYIEPAKQGLILYK